MKRQLLLKGLVIVDGDAPYGADIRVRGKRIAEIQTSLAPEKDDLVVDCSGQLASPAFINAHDHLHFNFYHRLGEPPYRNAQAWGSDLHSRWNRTIETIERIPIRDRYLWGAWKNLLSGVSRVVHHDPFSWHFTLLFPIDVLQRYTFIHSLYTEPDLNGALSSRKSGIPFIIHLAEGVDASTADEVRLLKNAGGLDERTIAVHAINICGSDISLLSASGASVVWCPSSNNFLFKMTTPIQHLRGKVPVAIGTDSTLTGVSTLFEELRVARNVSGYAPRELFHMVTAIPRKIFRLPPDAGTLRRGGRADLFLLSLSSSEPYEAILRAEPGDINLMLNRGKAVFFDDIILPALGHNRYSHRLRLNGRLKSFNDRRLSRLIEHWSPFLTHFPYLFAN